MTKFKPLLAALVAAGALGAAGYGLYAMGMHRGMSAAPASTAPGAAASSGAPVQTVPQGIAEGEEATRRHIKSGLKAGEVDPLTGKRILYYHDPMVPGNKFDKPAKSRTKAEAETLHELFHDARHFIGVPCH